MLLIAITLVLSLVVGGMAFFSGVVAPVVFKALDTENGGRFLRAIFPVYYLYMGVLSIVAMVLLYLDARRFDSSVLALIAAGFLFALFVLVPHINQVRDAARAGDGQAEKSFGRLHRGSVILNTIQFAAAFGILYRVLAP